MKKYIFLFLLILSVSAFGQSIDSSKTVMVRNIVLEGNKITKSHIITRELGFKIGEEFVINKLQEVFDASEKRIYSHNLFNEVDIQVLVIQGKFIDIKVKVDERWYIYPSLSLELVDKNFNDWWVNRNHDWKRVLIGGDLKVYNFRGRAEFLSLSAKFGYETRYSLGYRIPYINRNQNIGVGFYFSHQQTKNLAYKTENNKRIFNERNPDNDFIRTLNNVSVEVKYRPKFYATHSFWAGYKYVQIVDTLRSFSYNYLTNNKLLQQNFNFSYRFRWNNRDVPSYATEGRIYSLLVEKIGLGIFNDIDFWKIDGYTSQFFKLSKKWFIGTNLNFLYSYPMNQSFFNYSGMGVNRRAMRGHDIYAIESGRLITQSNDLKFKIFSYVQDISKYMPIKQFSKFPIALYAKVFFDHGYAKGYDENIGSQNLTDKYLYALGAGFDFVLINDFVIRLEYSTNTLNERHFFVNFQVSAF